MAKVFIDCGAHCGESIVRAKNQFGPDVQIISFEAVPQLADNLSILYENDDFVQICNAAVWIEDGIIDINICPAFTDGSSILTTLNDNHKAKTIQVPCFDLSYWLQTTFTEKDYIILKLDIEGAEYDVLQKMIDDESINLVRELWGEWHYGHIVGNLSESSKSEFDVKVDKIHQHLYNISKELKVWEAYYTNHPKLTKRPTTLYE